MCLAFCNFFLPHRGCLPGWAWGRSMCHTGVGKICLPSLTAVCAGCPASPAILVSAPTWRSLRCRAWRPIRALLLPTGSSVKRQLVRRANAHPHILKYIILLEKVVFFVQETPIRALTRLVRSLARCTPTAPTVPARPWSACGAAACSAASTPPHTSSLSPTASAWSGRLAIVWVSVWT